MPSRGFRADDDHGAAPPVLGPGQYTEAVDKEATEAEVEPVLPDPVFVPTTTAVTEQGLVEIQLRRTDQGELALPVYSSAEKLAACCGEDQIWTAFRAYAIPELMAQTEATAVLAPDTELPDRDGGAWE